MANPSVKKAIFPTVAHSHSQKRFHVTIAIMARSTNDKIHCGTYIKKILNEHEWLNEHKHNSRYPIPMKNESDFQKHLEMAQPSTTEKAQQTLEKKMGFKYRRAIGEFLYAMVTCRPNISFPVIKLS